MFRDQEKGNEGRHCEKREGTQLPRSLNEYFAHRCVGQRRVGLFPRGPLTKSLRNCCAFRAPEKCDLTVL
jgi:hypothetical protein